MPKVKRKNQENSAHAKRRKVHEAAASHDSNVRLSRRCESEIACDVENLSEYEKERLRNIQQNNAFLVELNLNQAKQDLNVVTQATKPRKVRGLSKPNKRPAAEELFGPRRQSLRLQRLNPTGEPLPEVPEPTPSIDEHKRNYFVRAVKTVGLKHMRQYASPRFLDECPRKPSGPLKMEPTNGIEQVNSDAFVCDLKDLSDEMDMNNLSDKRKEAKTSSYESSLLQLRIKEDHIAKLVPQRIFSLAFHPSERKSIVFAGDKWGRLGIWDVDSSQGEDGVYLYEPHSRPINCMSFDPLDCATLYTSSYDGSMRCCDVNTATFQEVHSFADDDYTRFIHFAFGSPSTRTILAGDDSGGITVLDTRIKKSHSIAEHKYQLHDRIIKCVDVHPLNRNIFLTSSNDCTVALWDLRNIKNSRSKLSCVQRSRSVTSAYFSPLTGQQIVSTSLDDYIAVYDVDNSGQVSTTPKRLFRHDNHVGRWLTSFRATWDPKSDSYFVVGSMNKTRQIDVYSSEKHGTAAMYLRHENLNSINSLNVFHPTLNLLAGGNSSGKVYLWTE